MELFSLLALTFRNVEDIKMELLNLFGGGRGVLGQDFGEEATFDGRGDDLDCLETGGEFEGTNTSFNRPSNPSSLDEARWKETFVREFLLGRSFFVFVLAWAGHLPLIRLGFKRGQGGGGGRG